MSILLIALMFAGFPVTSAGAAPLVTDPAVAQPVTIPTAPAVPAVPTVPDLITLPAAPATGPIVSPVDPTVPVTDPAKPADKPADTPATPQPPAGPAVDPVTPVDPTVTPGAPAAPVILTDPAQEPKGDTAVTASPILPAAEPAVAAPVTPVIEVPAPPVTAPAAPAETDTDIIADIASTPEVEVGAVLGASTVAAHVPAGPAALNILKEVSPVQYTSSGLSKNVTRNGYAAATIAIILGSFLLIGAEWRKHVIASVKLNPERPYRGRLYRRV